MCKLNNLSGGACLSNVAGTKGFVWACPAAEFNGHPATLTTTGEGDSVTLSGNFDFTGAAAGKGYWRKIPVVINKNSYSFTTLGSAGSKMFEESLTYQVAGVDKQQLEHSADILNVPLVLLCPDRNGVTHVIGRADDPAYLDTAEGNTGTAAGDDRAITITIKGVTGRQQVYNGLIDITPNP